MINGEPAAARTRRNRIAPSSASHRVDQLLDPVVDAAVGILAEHGALGLVVELEVYPVDGEVAATFLGAADEVAAQLRPGRLRWHVLRLEHGQVVGDPVDCAASLQEVVEAASTLDVVIGEI